MSWLSEALVPWWAKAALLGVFMATCAYGGWYVEGLRWSKDVAKLEAASQQTQVDLLKANLSIVSDALNEDSTQAITDAKSLEDLERIRNEVLKNIPATACLTPAGTDELRKLFE